MLPDCFRVRMEDMIGRNDVVRGRISRYLDMPDFKIKTKDWWNNIGGWSINNPKSVSRWWSGHRASFIRPRRFDIRAKINMQHPFWRISLPIFYKYYQGINSVFTKEEILMLEEIVGKWEKFTGAEMKMASHGEAPWIATKPNDVIDYNLSYYRNKYAEMSRL